MTLDEAIKERQKVIEVQEKLYEEASANESKEIIKSATDNDRQLAEWLRELKDLREEYAYISKVSYGYYKELKEAKRLLKLAVEDLSNIAAKAYNGGIICECCKWLTETVYCKCPNNVGCDITYQWRYVDEALKLIGDESSGI